MTQFEELYLGFGSFVITAGLVMIIVYTLTNPWWTDLLGRMMITYASAEVIMSSLLMMSIVFHFSPYWFRFAWFALQTLLGCTFWFQTYVIIRLHQRRRARERQEA